MRLLGLVLVLLASPVWAQSIQQSGSVTPGHPTMWTTNGIVQDAGTPQQGFITGLGIQNNGGPGICINSAPITAPYNELCFSVSTTGSALISLQNYGGATGQSLQCDINGVTTGCFGSSSTGSSSAGQYLVNSAGTVGGLGGTNCVMIESAGIPLCSTVSNSNLANMAADTVKCNSTSGLAAPTDCTLGQGANYLTATVLQIEPAKARMWPHVNQASLSNTAAFNAVDPWGNPINCGGTVSQCLNEFMIASAANGWIAEVNCNSGIPYSGGPSNPVWSNANQVIIEATGSVNVPVAQDWDFHAIGCLLNFNVTTVPGLVVDSQGASKFVWDGLIVYNVTSPNSSSCAISLNPVTNTDDGFAGMYAGEFHVSQPVSNGLNGGVVQGSVCFNTGVGSIGTERISFDEINCAHATNFGILVQGASSTTGLTANGISATQVHGCVLQSVNVGISATHASNYTLNQWTITDVGQFGVQRGIDTWGSYDTWDVGVISNAEGGLTYGIVTEASGSFNNFRFGQIIGFSLGLKLDTGNNNIWQGMGVLAFTPSPFSSLATCGGSSVTAGSLAMVSDSTTATWGATIAGGGGNSVLALCDASNVWTVVGK